MFCSYDLYDHARYRSQHAVEPVEILVHLVRVLHWTKLFLESRLALRQVSGKILHVPEDCVSAFGEAREVTSRINVQVSLLDSSAFEHLDRFHVVRYAAQVKADDQCARVTVEVIGVKNWGLALLN